MIRKNKVPKTIWYDNTLWKVEDAFSPTPYDDYILISRKIEDRIHSDHKTTPVEMHLIDVHNDEFFPNTVQVRNIMKIIKMSMDSTSSLERKLSDIWIEIADKVSDNSKRQSKDYDKLRVVEEEG